MEKRFEGLLEKLEERLQGFEAMMPLERMKAQVIAVRETLLELREMFLDGSFENVVDFFKSVKPRFYSLLIYAVERYNYEKERPVLPGEQLENFHAMQLEYIERSLRHHGFLYQYYLMGGTELDSIYFVPGASPTCAMDFALPEVDGEFSTIGDFLFSKFMALEKLKEVIIGEVRAPEQVATGAVIKSKKGRELKWTGDSCNLIELIYGIFDTRQVNLGEVDLSDLMDVFEQVFQINLSRYFRRFTEIKRRKTVSKTKFLDSMVEAVNKRIDEGDAYVPASMR